MGKEHLGLPDGKHPIISRVSTLETPKKSWDAYHLSFNHPFGGADCATDGSPALKAGLHLALAQGTEEVGGTDLGEKIFGSNEGLTDSEFDGWYTLW